MRIEFQVKPNVLYVCLSKKLADNNYHNVFVLHNTHNSVLTYWEHKLDDKIDKCVSGYYYTHRVLMLLRSPHSLSPLFISMYMIFTQQYVFYRQYVSSLTFAIFIIVCHIVYKAKNSLHIRTKSRMQSMIDDRVHKMFLGKIPIFL